MLIPEPGSSFRCAPLAVTEWSVASERWIVSVRWVEDWTLVGVFESAPNAFRAAALASERFAVLYDS